MSCLGVPEQSQVRNLSVASLCKREPFGEELPVQDVLLRRADPLLEREYVRNVWDGVLLEFVQEVLGLHSEKAGRW